jgi:hypothetical protein
MHRSLTLVATIVLAIGMGGLAYAQDPTTNDPPAINKVAIDTAYRNVPRFTTQVEDALNRYGLSLPDEWYPPIPSDPKDRRRPDPLALAVGRQVFSHMLDKYGFAEKANRVAKLSGAAELGLPSLNSIDWHGMSYSDQQDNQDNFAPMDCDESGGGLDNQSWDWLRIQGNQLGSANCSYWGWSAPGEEIGAGRGDRRRARRSAPGEEIGDGENGWGDVDHVFNCAGWLSVGSTSPT